MLTCKDCLYCATHPRTGKDFCDRHLDLTEVVAPGGRCEKFLQEYGDLWRVVCEECGELMFTNNLNRRTCGECLKKIPAAPISGRLLPPIRDY